MFTIWFRSYAENNLEHVDCERIEAARLIWDALTATGAVLYSARP